MFISLHTVELISGLLALSQKKGIEDTRLLITHMRCDHSGTMLDKRRCFSNIT